MLTSGFNKTQQARSGVSGAGIKTYHMRVFGNWNYSSVLLIDLDEIEANHGHEVEGGIGFRPAFLERELAQLCG